MRHEMHKPYVVLMFLFIDKINTIKWRWMF
jgi:hypothetical protein